jgi:hypothetical protein
MAVITEPSTEEVAALTGAPVDFHRPGLFQFRSPQLAASFISISTRVRSHFASVEQNQITAIVRELLHAATGVAGCSARLDRSSQFHQLPKRDIIFYIRSDLIQHVASHEIHRKRGGCVHRSLYRG